jgi:hypothetical protein
MPAFARYIGIDYSGAEMPTASLKGLRVYVAGRSSPPVEVMPPSSRRKYWTRLHINQTLHITPAMASGVTDHVWSVG